MPSSSLAHTKHQGRVHTPVHALTRTHAQTRLRPLTQPRVRAHTHTHTRTHTNQACKQGKYQEAKRLLMEGANKDAPAVGKVIILSSESDHTFSLSLSICLFLSVYLSHCLTLLLSAWTQWVESGAPCLPRRPRCGLSTSTRADPRVHPHARVRGCPHAQIRERNRTRTLEGASARACTRTHS